MTLTRRRFLSSLALAPVAFSTPFLVTSAFAAADREEVTLVVHGSQGPSRLTVEVADEAAERNRGLMGRERLADDAGATMASSDDIASTSGFCWSWALSSSTCGKRYDRCNGVVTGTTQRVCNEKEVELNQRQHICACQSGRK